MREGRGHEVVLGLILSGLVSRKKLITYLRKTQVVPGDNSLNSLMHALGISNQKTIILRESLDEAGRILANLRKNGCGVIALCDQGYPELLKQTASPPCLLFYKGDPVCLNTRSIAIVGSRRPSLAGMKMAHKLAFDLAGRGFLVVSGLARGIDTAAHRGALEAGGTTIAVLGSGIDTIYPAENEHLAAAISRGGLVLTEYPPGMPPLKQNFPQRNRIISGLCLGTIVVEAGVSSGALITAGFALQQNREVFAVPSSPLLSQSGGVNRLLKEGAALVESADDVIAEIAPQLGESSDMWCEDHLQLDIDNTQMKVVELLSNVPVHIDEIARALDLGSAKTLALLFELETRGLVKSLPGKFYVRQ